MTGCCLELGMGVTGEAKVTVPRPCADGRHKTLRSLRTEISHQALTCRAGQDHQASGHVDPGQKEARLEAMRNSLET